MVLQGAPKAWIIEASRGSGAGGQHRRLQPIHYPACPFCMHRGAARRCRDADLSSNMQLPCRSCSLLQGCWESLVEVVRRAGAAHCEAQLQAAVEQLRVADSRSDDSASEVPAPGCRALPDRGAHHMMPGSALPALQCPIVGEGWCCRCDCSGVHGRDPAHACRHTGLLGTPRGPYGPAASQETHCCGHAWL